jgi:hypothetical protein
MCVKEKDEKKTNTRQNENKKPMNGDGTWTLPFLLTNSFATPLPLPVFFDCGTKGNHVHALTCNSNLYLGNVRWRLQCTNQMKQKK